MSYWTTIDDPSQELLDSLWKKATARKNRPCPDCGAEVGNAHHAHCDVARCQACGGQAFSCGCPDVGSEVWSGVWPGVALAYRYKLVCFGPDKEPIFDLNRVEEMRAELYEKEKGRL